MPRHQLFIDPLDFSIKLGIFLSLQRKQLARQFRDRFICRYALKKRDNPTHTGRRRNAELGAIPTYGIGELSALLDEPLSHTNQHKRRLLFGGLYWDEAHRGAACCFTESLCIRRVVLATLDVRLRQLRRNQLHLMPE